MSTPKIFLVVAAFLGISIGTSSADSADRAGESDFNASRDATPTSETNETPVESQKSQVEISAELNDASIGPSEDVVALVEAMKERHKDESFVEYITEDVVSENLSIIEKFDSDGDGGLSKKEFAHALKEPTETAQNQSLAPDEFRDFVEEEFKDMDLDEDSKISLEEVTIFMAEFVQAINVIADNYDSTKRNEEGSSSSIESVDGGQPD